MKSDELNFSVEGKFVDRCKQLLMFITQSVLRCADLSQANHVPYIRSIGKWTLTSLVINVVIGTGIFGLPSE